MKTKKKIIDAHSVDVNVGKRIKEFRRSKGMTQKDVGKHIGVRFQQIQKYESALNRVSAGKLFMIAKLLEVDIADLFEEGSKSDKGNQAKVKRKK